MMKGNFVIREAQENDCLRIFSMIKAKSAFEGNEDHVIISPEALLNDGFGKNRFYHALVAEMPDKEIVGYLIFNYAYSTWNGKIAFLEDIFVQEAHRRKGIATALLKKVNEILISVGCKQCRLPNYAWNMNAMSLFKKFGVQNLTETEEWNFLDVNIKEELN